MPKLKSSLNHNLGKDEAIRRLKNSCEWARGFSDLREVWTNNVMEFYTSIQGVKINGTIEVAQDALHFIANVPLIALPFKSWIPNILKNALKDRDSTVRTENTAVDTPVLLYLHIPKAGGTTLGEFIYNQCRSQGDYEEGLIKNGVFFMADGFFRENEATYSPKTQESIKRDDLRAIIGHFAFGIHQFVTRPFHYITILRNPVSRVTSLYHYLKLESKMSLEEFAQSCPYRETDNDQTRRIAGINPDIGQCTEKDLEIAKENLRNHFSVVGTTERFDETLVLLKKQFDWSQDVSVFPRNVNPDRNKVAPNNAAIIAIQNQNSLDIALYDYANQLMNERIATQGEEFQNLLKVQVELNSNGSV